MRPAAILTIFLLLLVAHTRAALVLEELVGVTDSSVTGASPSVVTPSIGDGTNELYIASVAGSNIAATALASVTGLNLNWTLVAPAMCNAV